MALRLARTPTSGPARCLNALNVDQSARKVPVIHHPQPGESRNHRGAPRKAAPRSELCYAEPLRSEPASRSRSSRDFTPRPGECRGQRTRHGLLEMSDIVEMRRERMRRRSAGLLPPAAGSGMIQSGDAAAAAAGCFVPAQLGAKDK